MEALMKIFVFLYLLYLGNCDADLGAVFEKFPDEVQETFTKTMVIRCSVNHKTTGDDVGHITSLVITRDGEHLATVTEFDPSRAFGDLDNLKVTGTISGNFGELGYIELQWIHPSRYQQGKYKCVLNGLNKHGDCISSSKTLDVHVSTPNIDDLMNHVSTTQLKDLDLKGLFRVMSNAVVTCQAKISEINDSVNTLKTDNTNLKNEVSSLKTDVNDLPASDPVIFSAGIDRDIHVTAGTVMKYNRIFINAGKSYDPNTGHFVCKKPGLYRFDIVLKLSADNHSQHFQLYHNERYVMSAHCNPSYRYATAGNNVVLQLSVGDVVKVVARETSQIHGYGKGVYATFSGLLLA